MLALNAAVFALHLRCVTTFEGFERPWSHIEEFVGYLQVETLAFGAGSLVDGATGAIGSAAVQLLKAPRSERDRSLRHRPHQLGRGARRRSSHRLTTDDFTADEQRSDLVFDTFGKRSFGECKRLLKRRGIYCSTDLGPLSQNPMLALVSPLLRAKRIQFRSLRTTRRRSDTSVG